jgi:hypothetical protein
VLAAPAVGATCEDLWDNFCCHCPGGPLRTALLGGLGLLGSEPLPCCYNLGLLLHLPQKLGRQELLSAQGAVPWQGLHND